MSSSTYFRDTLKTIEYYFDFLSPYSYLSWQWVRDSDSYLEKNGYRWDYKPVVLGSIIQHYETKGPAEIASKRDYLFKDCDRFSKQHDFSFEVPAVLPFNSLYPLRLALSSLSGAQQSEVIELLFLNSWGKGKDISEPSELSKILNDAGHPGEKWLEDIGQKEVRRQLKDNVKDALSKGVFGLPAFFVNNELFWGNDSIPSLKLFIEGRDSLDIEKFNNFSERFGKV